MPDHKVFINDLFFSCHLTPCSISFSKPLSHRARQLVRHKRDIQRECPELVAKAPYPLYPVVEEGRLVGQITPYDILKTLLAFARQRGWQTSR